jgi:hypothetical protein
MRATVQAIGSGFVHREEAMNETEEEIEAAPLRTAKTRDARTHDALNRSKRNLESK